MVKLTNIDERFGFYKSILLLLQLKHKDRYVLIHSNEHYLIFNTCAEGIKVGTKIYGMGNFIIQSIPLKTAHFARWYW